MKGKSLVIWVLVLAAAAAAWFLSGHWQEKNEKAQAQTGRLLTLNDPLAVAGLSIGGREAAKPIRIERQEKEHRWLIKEPVTWPADGGQVGRLIDALLAAQAKDRLQAIGRLADFGLAPPAFQVSLIDRDGAKAEALFGELSPAKDYLYAALAGSSEVLFLPADLRKQIDKTLFDLRDKRALDFVATDVSAVKVKLGDRRLDLARQGEGPQYTWQLKDLGLADTGQVDTLVFQARGAMATSFLDEGINLERMGLDKPWGEIRLGLAGGAEVGLMVGGQVAGQKPGETERYVRRLEGGPVMTVKQESLDRLAPAPKEVQERRLLKLERDKIIGLAVKSDGQELRYERKEGGFTRVSPAGDAQAGEAADMFLFDLLNLRWDNRQAAGKPLDQTGAVITVTLAATEGQARKESLVLGPLKGDGPLEARVEGDDQAYFVPREFAGKLPSAEGQAADQ